MEKIFALYKGETWIWDGTIQELSDYTGKSFESVRWLQYDSAKKRALAKKDYQGFWLEPIEEESV